MLGGHKLGVFQIHPICRNFTIKVIKIKQNFCLKIPCLNGLVSFLLAGACIDIKSQLNIPFQQNSISRKGWRINNGTGK